MSTHRQAEPHPDPRPNPRLIQLLPDYSPASASKVDTSSPTALDLGSGNGGDALWLATEGWRVTAVDISDTAVNHLADKAEAAGLDKQVSTASMDLAETFPTGRYDLVNVHYLHTTDDLDRHSVLRKAARALKPGGTLLIVDHGSIAPWSWNQDPLQHFPHPADLAADLDLDPHRWRVALAEPLERTATGPDGTLAKVTDHVLVIRRKDDRDTPPPRTGNSEIEVLRGFLDYLRTSVAGKLDGIDASLQDAARTPAVPSGTNLLGLVHHLTAVERSLFLGETVSRWATTFRAPAGQDAATVAAGYRDAVERANRVLDTCNDPASPLPHAPAGKQAPSVRWALAHMTEETARHAGHADILRELIDGSTGR